MESYFQSFPQVSYNGFRSRNIVSRSAMTSEALSKYGIFYPYQVKDHERPDTIAFDYYGDSKYFWLVLMANDIQDPYHDWPLSERDFKAYIIKKYGSEKKAMQNIMFYAAYGTDLIMSVESRLRLPPSQKLGFDYPVYAYDYERKQNEAKKRIKLLSKQYAERAYTELKASYTNDRV